MFSCMRNTKSIVKVTQKELTTQLGHEPSPAEAQMIETIGWTRAALAEIQQRLALGTATDKDINSLNRMTNTVARCLAYLGLLDRVTPNGQLKRPDRTRDAIITQ